MRFGLVQCVAVLGLAAATAEDVAAQGRQYYDTAWTYNSNNGYYYRRYYYQPVVTVTTYTYDYTIYYPAQPRYVYYYNPRSNVYWGRYEIGEDGQPKGYSLLEDKDKKEKLKDVPEAAFPKPGEMPPIPGAADKVKMDPPPLKDLPTDAKK